MTKNPVIVRSGSTPLSIPATSAVHPSSTAGQRRPAGYTMRAAATKTMPVVMAKPLKTDVPMAAE